jgi:hypothetical protein
VVSRTMQHIRRHGQLAAPRTRFWGTAKRPV